MRINKDGIFEEDKEIAVDYEINADNISKETAYKFMAYYIRLIDYFDTIEELEKIIENGLNRSIDDFTEEELDGIVKYNEFIEY